MAAEHPTVVMSVRDRASTLKPRAYQQEMLAESLRQNTIIAVSPVNYIIWTMKLTKIITKDGHWEWEDTNVRHSKASIIGNFL
jgi:hypothetical protein